MQGNNPYAQQPYGNPYAAAAAAPNPYGMNPYAQQQQQQPQINPYMAQPQQPQQPYYNQQPQQQQQGYYNNQMAGGMPPMGNMMAQTGMGHPQNQYQRAQQDNPYNISRSGSTPGMPGQQINMNTMNKKRPRSSSGPREVTAANLPRAFVENPTNIAQYFSKCGTIMQMHVPRFPDTGKPKSLAYLKFSTVEEAQLALKLNGEYIGKKQIRVHISSKQNEFTGSTKTIDVKNYMYGVLKDKVQSDFAQYGKISNIEIKGNPSSGTADVNVTFFTIDAVENAINSYNPYLFIGESHFDKRAKHSESQHISSSHEGLHQQQRGGTELFVCRIPPEYYMNQDKLRALFEEAGKILSVNILKNKESGKPKSMSYIRFSNAAEAQRAIEMFNNKVLVPNERSIGVGYSKNQCGVFSGKTQTVRIGNLPSDVSDDEVRKDFSTHGEISNLNVVRKRGQVFAFVTYSDVDSVKKALAVPHQHINIEEWQESAPPKTHGAQPHRPHHSSHVPPPQVNHMPPQMPPQVPQYSNYMNAPMPYQQQQQQQQRMMGMAPPMATNPGVGPMGSAPSKKYLDYHEVFVGNIPYEVCNEHFLRREFGQFGPIIDMRIPTNKQNQPKGFVFIRYQNTQSAMAACVKNNTMLANRNINVKITEKTMDHGPSNSNFNNNHQRRNARSSRFRDDNVPKSNTEVHIENLPFSHCSKDKLRDIFGSFGAIRHIKFPPPSSKGTPRGYAYVDFDRPEDARKARSLDRTVLDGRTIAINYADLRPSHYNSNRSPNHSPPSRSHYSSSRSPQHYHSSRSPQYNNSSRSPQYSPSSSEHSTHSDLNSKDSSPSAPSENKDTAPSTTHSESNNNETAPSHPHSESNGDVASTMSTTTESISSETIEQSSTMATSSSLSSESETSSEKNDALSEKNDTSSEKNEAKEQNKEDQDVLDLNQ